MGRKREKKLFSVQHCAPQCAAELLMLLYDSEVPDERSQCNLCIMNMHSHKQSCYTHAWQSPLREWLREGLMRVQRSEQTRERHVAHTCSELTSILRQIIKCQMQSKLRKSLVACIVQGFSLAWKSSHTPLLPSLYPFAWPCFSFSYPQRKPVWSSEALPFWFSSSQTFLSLSKIFHTSLLCLM